MPQISNRLIHLGITHRTPVRSRHHGRFCCCRRLRVSRRRWLLDAWRHRDKPRKQDTQFVKQTERHGEHDLRDHVRRRKNGADHESANDHVRSPFLEFWNGHNAHVHQHDDNHRHLEGHPESNEGRQHKGQIFVDVGHPRHAIGSNLGHEAKNGRENEKVGEGHAGEKQKHTGAHQRHGQTFFVLVQARRNKSPHLIKDIG